MLMEETLDEAIQALEHERLYDALVQANRYKLLTKSWNEWVDIVFTGNPPNPQYQFLRDAYKEFESIQKAYYEKIDSNNDIFYKFEEELGKMITNFQKKYNDLVTVVDPILIEQASATQWFIDDCIRKSPSYIEYIRSQLFNKQREFLLEELGNDNYSKSFGAYYTSKLDFITIQKTLIAINKLGPLEAALNEGSVTLQLLENVISNFNGNVNDSKVLEEFRVSTKVNNFFQEIQESFHNGKTPTSVQQQNFNSDLQDIKEDARNILSQMLQSNSKLTIDQFEKLTIANTQRLVLASISKMTPRLEATTTMKLFGLTSSVMDDFGINYIHDNFLERMLIEKKYQGTTLKQFSQIEFESKLDFIKQGHCLSYSFLYILYATLGGTNEVNRKFTEMDETLKRYDLLYIGQHEYKTKIDNYRTVVNGFYDDYYKGGSQLNACIDTDRPTNTPKGYYFSLSRILDELELSVMAGNEKSRSALIRTGNHALALSYSSTNGKYQFFDPNVGVVEYKTKAHIEAALTNYFTRLAKDYNVLTRFDDGLGIRDGVFLNADFINEKLAKDITKIPLGSEGIKITESQFAIVTPEAKEANVSHVLEADYHARTLQRELPEMMQRGILDHHWIPNFNALTESAEGVWKLPFVHDKDSVVREIQIDSKRLQRALAFLKKQGKKLRAAFSWENGQIQVKPGISEETHMSGMEGLNLLGAVQMFMASAKAHKEVPQQFTDSFALGLEIFAWANVALNIAQTATDVIHTGLIVVGKEGAALISKALTSSVVTKGLNSLGLVSGGVSVGLDAYELDLAIKTGDSVAIDKAVTSLTFDSVSFGLGATGLLVGETAGVFSGALAVPVAGLSIGFTALIEQLVGNLNQALAAFRFLGGDIYNAYEVGGYKKNDEGILVPQYAVMQHLDFTTGKVKFGETLLQKNSWWGLEPPQRVRGYIDMRAGFGLPSTAPLDKTAEIIVLPQTGNVKLQWDIVYTSTALSARHDWGLDRLTGLYYRTGKQFTPYNGFWAIYNIQQKYDYTTVEITLDETPRQLIMPPLDSYPNTTPGYYDSFDDYPDHLLTWTMHYLIHCNGGNYALAVNNKPNGEAWVDIKENKNTASTWVIHAGDSVSDDITDLHATSQWGPYFRLGGVFIAVQAKQTKIFVAKNNGELWQCDLTVERAIFIGVVTSAWIKANYVSSLNSQMLVKLAQDQQVEQMLVVGIPTFEEKNLTQLLEDISSNVTYLNGIYSTETNQIQCENEQGIIYTTTIGQVIFRNEIPLYPVTFTGVNAMTWQKKHPESHLFNVLSTLAKVQNKAIIDVYGIQNESNQAALSGQYFANASLLFAVSSDGKMYQVKPDSPTTLVALTSAWFQKQANKVNAINSTTTASPQVLAQVLQEQKTWVNEFQKLLSNETAIATILPLHGVTSKYNITREQGDALSVWYDVSNKQFIVAGGLINRTLEYVGQGNGLAWLFDQEHGKVYIQSPAGNGTQYLFDFSPLAIQPFRSLGKLLNAKQLSRGRLRVDNDNDMTFELSSSSAMLVRTGEQCNFSWNEIWNQAKEKHYQMAEIIYTYDPPHADYPQGDHYWYHSPSKTKFRPLDKKIVDNGNIDDYDYIGYSSTKKGIYLFDKEKHVLNCLGLEANSTDYGLIARNIIRFDDILAIDGVLQTGPNIIRKEHMLPEIDAVKSLILNLSPQENYLKINWLNNNSYTRVVIDTFGDSVATNEVFVTVFLADVTPDNFKNNFTTRRNGNDLEVIDTDKSLVFRDFTNQAFSNWWIVVPPASVGMRLLSVEVVDLEKELKKKTSQIMNEALVRTKRSLINARFNLEEDTEDDIVEMANQYLEKYDHYIVKKSHAPRKTIKKISKYTALNVTDDRKLALTEKPHDTHQWQVENTPIKKSNHHLGSKTILAKQINPVKPMVAQDTRSKSIRFFTTQSTPRLVLSTPVYPTRLIDKNYKKPFISESSVRPSITHQRSGGAHTRHTPLSQVTAQIDISSTLFAVDVLTRVANGRKYQPPPSEATAKKYKKMETQSEKIKADVYRRPRMEKIEVKAKGFNLR